MIQFLKRIFGNGAAISAAPLQPESQFIVRTTDAEVICQRPDGQEERIAWDDLQAFIVETNDAGPFAPDVFWILVGSSPSSGCIFPQGATGERAVLERLQALPGFDNEAFGRAMCSTDNASFPCWKRA
jgi:hypothetical protein